MAPEVHKQARDIVMRRVLGRVGACTQRVGREEEEREKKYQVSLDEK